MSKSNTVDLYVSQLITDLANGKSWFKKDDMGFGSIQETYGANEIQIKTIQKHPKLAGLEPSVTVFRVIDDLKEESNDISASKTDDGRKPAKSSTESKQSAVEPSTQSETQRRDNPGSGDILSGKGLSVEDLASEMVSNGPGSDPVTDAESADAFFNL